MKLLFFCFLFFLNLNLCAQQDSGYFAHQHYTEYERLKEFGEYEKAQLELNQAIQFKGISFRDYSKMPQLIEIKFFVDNETSDSLKYEFRIEIAQNALDTADSKKWNETGRHLKSAYIASAKSNYDDAQQYIAKPTSLAREIDKRILTIPIDTIYSLNPLINDLIYIQPLEFQSNRKRFLSNVTARDTFYSKRDSMHYNGVFVHGANIQNIRKYKQYYYNQTFSQSFWIIENGLIVDQTHYGYQTSQTYDSLGNLSTVFFQNSIYQFNRNTFTLFNYKGDTTEYQYQSSTGERNIKLNNKGDTAEYRHESFENEIRIVENVHYKAPGDTSFYYRLEKHPDSTVSKIYVIGEHGDTLNYTLQINDKMHGLQWDSGYHGVENLPVRINTNWRNDTLFDILGDKVIYVNEKCKIISEKEFLSIYTKSDILNYYYNRLDIPKEFATEVEPIFVFYSGNKNYSYYDRKLKSILKQYKKSIP
ncbi:MAG: hypothetical protein ACI8ZM_000564 [Crocinitomix sp.]|jgi:hypothetical protein